MRNNHWTTFFCIWIVILSLNLNVALSQNATIGLNSISTSNHTSIPFSTYGAFDVSEIGSAIYNIPIKNIGRGELGINPDISICYNSNLKNGIVGWGFSLTGISLITRGTKNIFHDGSPQRVSFSHEDAFYLDGKRLILTEHTFMSDSAVYCLEDNRNAKIILHGLNGSTYQQWFSVNLNNGIIYEYGNGDGLKKHITSYDTDWKVSAWYITKAENNVGNYLKYKYNTDSLCLYPKQIMYGHKLDNINDTVIYFDYEQRNDTVRLAVEGANGIMRYRLKQIGTHSRVYKLQYNDSGDMGATRYSRLVSVTECKPNGEALRPTVFEWNYIPDFSQTTHRPSFNQIPAWNSENNSRFFTAGDLNGDGLADIVEMTKTATGDEYENRITINYASKDSLGQVKYAAQHCHALPNDNYHSVWNDCRTAPMSIDFNGDGITELVIPHRVFTESEDYVEFQILYPSGLQPGSRYDLNGNDFIYDIADLNNDGRNEIFVIRKGSTGFSSAAIIGLDSLDNNFIKTVSLSISENAIGLHLTDFNRDGMPDAIIFYSNRYAIYLNDGNWVSNDDYININNNIYIYNLLPSTIERTYVGNFNGDTEPDFLLVSNDNIKLYFADFNGFNSLEYTDVTPFNDESSFCSYMAYSANYHVYDFDGDGKTDVVINKFADDITTTYWYRSKGASLEFIKEIDSYDANDILYQHYTIGDFNGDGLYELANHGGNCYHGGNSNSAYWNIYYNDTDYACMGKIASITNGLGVKTCINYKPMADSTVYRRNIIGLKFPVVDMKLPLSLVSSVTTIGGAIGVETKKYCYKSMRLHLQGRGFIGFMSIITNNESLGLSSELNIKKWSNKTFKPIEVLEQTTIGEYVNEKKYYYDTDIDEHNIISYQLRKTTTINAIGNTSTTEYYYDNNGNIIKEVLIANDSNSIIKKYQNYTYIANKYQPTIFEQENKHYSSNVPFIQRINTTYDNRGLIISQIKSNGTNLPLTATYTYNDYGNIVSKSESGLGVTPVTEYYDYDNTHRFILRKYTTSYPKIKISYAYDIEGNLISIMDSTRTSCPQTTTYTYDVWGRKSSETSPNRQRKTYSYALASSSPECYSILEQGTAIPKKETWYDAYGRELRQETFGPYDIPISTIKIYNSWGQVAQITKSVDYVETTTNYTYDAIGRLLSESTNTGKSKTYSYSGNTITSTIDGKAYSTTYDSWGNVIETSGPDGNMSYLYHSCGKPVSVTSNGATVSMEYDDCGNQIKLIDPDAGTMTYTYDALGRVTKETDASGNTTTYSYNKFGKVSSLKVNNDYQTSYGYSIIGNTTGLLNSVTCNTNRTYKINYTYDAYNRVTKEVHNIPNSGLLNTDITYKYTYNTQGLLETMTYPGNVIVRYTYDNYGYKTSTSVNGQTVWALEATDGFETTINRGQNLTSTERIDMNGNLVYGDIARNGTILHQMAYTYNANNGNMLSRTGMFNSQETFSYDDADRLTGVTGGMTAEYRYASNGNMIFKTGIGIYTYDSPKPHAVTGVENTDGLIDRSTLYTSYNSIGKIATIHDTESGYRMVFNYGPDNARCDALLYNALDTSYHITYLPGCDVVSEKDQDGEYTHQWYYYIGDGVVYYRDNYGNSEVYYTFTDNLGSITRLYDDDGDMLYSANYDPWGKLSTSSNEAGMIRGYTGHEHIWPFGFINMNGRLYDPLLGRFLSTDNFVQEPLNAQNFNRYSYCLNNPLKYNDPSGELIFSALTALTDFVGNIFKHGFNISQYNWKKTVNAWKIDMGMFKGNIGQIINKWTWGAFNSVVGNVTAHSINLAGYVDGVTDMDGMLALSGVTGTNGGAFTIGHYSFGPKKYKADWRDHLFVHEYGHYIQSQHLGPLYLPIIAPASLISAGIGESTTGTEHRNRWFEVWASSLGSEYFDKKYGTGKSDYIINHKDFFDIESFRKSGYSPYINPRTGKKNYNKYFPTSDPTITFWDFFIF